MTLRKILVLSALFCAPAIARAQGGTCFIASNATSCTSAQTVTASMPQIATMTLSGDVILSVPGASDFVGNTAVMTNSSAGSVTIKTNKAYNLTVESNAANFTAGQGFYGTSKPAGDLEVKVDANAFQTVSTSGITLALAQAKTEGRAHNIAYRTTYKLSQDTPDRYTLALTYSLTTP